MSETDNANAITASVVLVEPGQMAAFTKRLDALNRKAEKFGLPPIKVIKTTDALYERKHEYVGRDEERLLSYLTPASRGCDSDSLVMIKRLEIEYPEIKLGQWRVVGKLEALEAGNLAFAVSRERADVEALTVRADCPIECEHCNTSRRRKDGYLLRDSESGEYKEVGSNCLEDFTGIDPSAALFLAQMWSVVKITQDDFDELGRSGRVNAIGTSHYLAAVSFMTENFGFVSTAKARDSGILPTYDDALSLPRTIERDDELRRKYLDQFDRHLERAEDVRNWIKTKPEESMFDRNLKLLFDGDAISLDRKHLAFAAAAVPMYNRSLAERVEARQSRHIGNPGEKGEATLTVERIIPLTTAYGVSDIVLMADQEGNKFKWKTASCPSEIRNDGIGRSMTATFKVKGHEDYKGTAQTTITHLKVLRWVDAAALDGKGAGAAPVMRDSDSPAVRSAKARFLSEHGASDSAPESERPRDRMRL
ncbi:hypothetical protein [Paraburkholderia hospita]|uniref:hypothetical protein n=1 Tax=Paraburkholderia hospita TaxID=169430 RepID=UPI0008A755FC|nr:hypothetical protein [Paraburkholderia hospita]SEI14551.1 hypothetical protein SAMN05192544_102560 [Paraburkholderia hospita]